MVKLCDFRKSLKNEYGSLTDIDVIILNNLKIDRAKLYTDIDLKDSEVAVIKKNAERLIKGEPVEYIIGHKEFMSLNFKVDRNTLIPRADTEILVEELIKLYNGKSPNFFEIGTGSGCIAVSLAYYLPNARIFACDISDKALEIAKLNAKNNNVDDRITFFQCDILSDSLNLPILPDCIVSNPPYIETSVIDTLSDKVKNFEPYIALNGGEDGLRFYRKITNCFPLSQKGVLAFEIGYNQGNAVVDIMKSSFKNIKIIKDLGGNDRVVLGTKE